MLSFKILLFLWAFVAPSVVVALPGVVFDHPTQDFQFFPTSPGESAQAIFAIRGVPDDEWPLHLPYHQAAERWQQWQIVVELNAVEVSRWDAVDLMNALGEVKAHISVPALEEGEHVASCRLLQAGAELDLEHTITFFISSHPPPSSHHDEWTPFLCPACPDAHQCAVSAESVDQQVLSTDCNGHGVCVRGTCVCAADWAGDTCRHSLLHEKFFLPDLDPASSLSRCVKSVAWSRDEFFFSRQGHDILDRGCPEYAAELGLGDHSNTQESVQSKLLLFGPPTHGLGFNIHYVSHMVGWAYSTGRVPVMVESAELGQWTYGRHDECPYKGWGCFFLPITSCDLLWESLLSRGLPVHSRADGIPQRALHPPLHKRGNVSGVPTHGQLWWRAQLVGAIVRPNDYVASLLRKVRNGLGLRSPYISVHVRMGDSCTHGGRYAMSPDHAVKGCVGPDRYAEAALRISQKYNVSTVFLATDSAEAGAVLRGRGLEVRELSMDRGSLFDSSWLIEHRIHAHAVNNTLVSISAVLDLLLLTGGDYFVGSFGGHLSRLALELMVHDKGYVVPYVSVDRPWCFDAGKEYGTGFIDFC